jgi:F-type H+-transporting ATPase subunit b
VVPLTTLLAADGSITAIELMPAITALVVFVIFFLVLRATVWPKILKGLDERESKIRGEIAAAEEARQRATAALAEYEQNLAAARKEAATMIAQAKADAKAAAAELKARNEAELGELKQRAMRELENARRAAVAELHAESANLAADIAARILKREINADDQKRLADDTLGELAAARSK